MRSPGLCGPSSEDQLLHLALEEEPHVAKYCQSLADAGFQLEHSSMAGLHCVLVSLGWTPFNLVPIEGLLGLLGVGLRGHTALPGMQLVGSWQVSSMDSLVFSLPVLSECRSYQPCPAQCT